MRSVRRIVFIVASLALVCCGHPGRAPQSQTSPASATPPPATPAPAATVAPARPALQSTPKPTAKPLPVAPSAAPSAAPARPVAALPPAPKSVERLAPDAPPQILDVAVSQTTVQSGDRVVGRVTTSSNVASVEARIGGYSVALAKVGVGRFELAYTVGPLPWFVHGNFTMQVIARNTRGVKATRAIPLKVR
jgi:glucose/arabinose dehydrogenase